MLSMLKLNQLNYKESIDGKSLKISYGANQLIIGKMLAVIGSSHNKILMMSKMRLVHSTTH